MKILSRVLMIIILSGITTFVIAQPGDPGDPPRIPIDAGASILLAAGALYGAKKIYDTTKQSR